MSWDWRIRSYNRKNQLLLETVHKGNASKWAELQAYKARMQRGDDITRIEIVALTSLAPTVAINDWKEIEERG
jgi:hypothetical protein